MQLIESSARRAGPEMARESSAPRKMFAAADSEMSVAAAREVLKKRLAVELDAVHDLVRKAKILSRGKKGRFLATDPRPEAPVEACGKAPSPKRRKTSPLVEQIGATRMSPEEGEFVPEQTKIKIVPGQRTIEFVPEESSNIKIIPEESEIKIVPEEEGEYVDICSDATPVAIRDASTPIPLELAGEICSSPSASDSGSSSSSDSDSGSDTDGSSSDSDSESDSDSDASVNSPAPPAVPSPQPQPEPASQVVRSAEPEKFQEVVAPPAGGEKRHDDKRPAPTARPMSRMAVLLARAQEALEIRQKQGMAWEREKLRRELLEMEKAALPDESIHPRDMEQLGIARFQYIVSTVRPLASGSLRAPPRRLSVLQKLDVFLKPDA